MPKRIKDIFFNKLKFLNMYNAYERASKGKHKNKEVIIFEFDLANNIINILKELYSGKYKTGVYRKFKVYEPKERIIESLPFKDRIVQQWYIEEFIKPIFVPKFIQDTYACIEKRGVHKCVKKLYKYMYNYEKENLNFYILKCDVKKFFYSINKQKLYSIIKKYVKDKYFLNLTKELINNNNEKYGIPIGNYTSQYFANIYLNELDHYVKEKLKVKYYVRYMDDFALLLEDKNSCRNVLNKISEFLKNELDLQLNQKTNYFKQKQGINFCGYKIYSSHILVKKENIKKMKRKIKKWNKLYEQKKIKLKQTTLKLNSWIGHAHNADSFKLINKILKECNWIYNDKI